MEFFFTIFFLLFYYIRPQDWVSGLSGMNLIQPIIGGWLLVMFAARSRPSPLQGLARTPHDWLIFIYLSYIVLIGDGAIMSILPFLAFYLLTIQSISTWKRLRTYLVFWNGALVAIAAIAILSKFGIDLTGAQDNFFTKTGRLAIGTWLHNNPNALCHAIVAALASSYTLYFWKGTSSGKALAFPLCAGIVFYCAWMTQSKGGYIAGAVTLLFALILGRPRWLQILAISMALVGGISVLSFLPRMNEMGDLRNDEGYIGRVLAWQMARTTERNNPTGVGWKDFIAEVHWEERGKTVIVPKATHSSYVQVGADLGRYGLFLYLAVLWCAFHTVLSVKSSNTLEERCRRVILLFLIANAVSGWMVNRQYHTEYFLMIAAAAAFHRLKKAEELSVSSEPETPNAVPDLPQETVMLHARIEVETADSKKSRASKPIWNRFGVRDVCICIALTWLTLFTWDYLMRN